jgi:four helix bundle protein
MGKFNSFEDIIAWQKARVLNKEIYDITNTSDLFARDYALRDQIRRASISISSNIAEGFERETAKEFIRFLYVAKASAGEFRSQLYLAIDLDYIKNDVFKNLKTKANDVSRLISGLIKYLKSTL